MKIGPCYFCKKMYYDSSYLSRHRECCHECACRLEKQSRKLKAQAERGRKDKAHTAFNHNMRLALEEPAPEEIEGRCYECKGHAHAQWDDGRKLYASECCDARTTNGGIYEVENA